MAAAAEIHDQLAPEQYLFVDDIPELAEARANHRRAGQLILDERRREGKEASELLPIDALSTADGVLEARKQFGEDSVEYKQRLKGLRLDCSRLVAEWYRKKKPEHFQKVRHVFDRVTQDYFSHGLSARQLTENALVPVGDDVEEEERRLNERVEDETPRLVRGIGVAAVGIRTISQCTNKAITDYAYDMKHGHKHRGYRGYVPEIEKVMIRDITLEVDTEDRFEEQLGLPGTYITHEIFQIALGRRGLDASKLDKTGLHGAQMLARDDIFDFARLLDDVASEQWGHVNIFMGELVPDDFVKDYDGFRAEALQRQAELKDLSDGVADFVLGLAEEQANRKEAPAIVEEFVKAQLIHLVRDNFEMAEQVFDTRTARGLQEVAYLESIGQIERANERLGEIQQQAPGGGFCGAGSCGIVALSELSERGQKARELGLGSGLMHDTVRSCPDCKTKNIAYDSKANKGCTKCGSKQIDGKRSKGKAAFTLAA
jgi:hypothetical protein